MWNDLVRRTRTKYNLLASECALTPKKKVEDVAFRGFRSWAPDGVHLQDQFLLRVRRRRFEGRDTEILRVQCPDAVPTPSKNTPCGARCATSGGTFPRVSDASRERRSTHPSAPNRSPRPGTREQQQYVDVVGVVGREPTTEGDNIPRLADSARTAFAGAGRTATRRRRSGGPG